MKIGQWAAHHAIRREFLRFGVVGATAWVVDTAVFISLKSTVLHEKPLTAKVLAVLVATLVSYLLNREWSFQTRGGRRPGSEAALFFGVSAISVGLYVAPLWISRYVLGLEAPNVSHFTQNVADLVAGQIVGVLIGMTFRWWAFRRFVFPTAELTVVPAGAPGPVGAIPQQPSPESGGRRPASRSSSRPGTSGIR